MSGGGAHSFARQLRSNALNANGSVPCNINPAYIVNGALRDAFNTHDCNDYSKGRQEEEKASA